uniref:Alkaline ceramidase n=1 Tax=Sus scrofa TaxID=9823 RepID=A0A8W4FF48_PIG
MGPSATGGTGAPTPTSMLDQCKGNYLVTWYIAESWNRVSNLIIITPPIFGAFQSVKRWTGKNSQQLTAVVIYVLHV